MDNAKFITKQLIESLRQLSNRINLESWFCEEFFIKNFAGDDKFLKIKELLNQVSRCELCALHKTKKNVVFGEGNLNAEIIFVGEAPGQEEDLSGRPFVGDAGRLLTKIINAMGLERRSVYITNVLRCHPPGNRDPLPSEINNCRPYLLKLLKVINPKIICTLGRFAAGALLNEQIAISKQRGIFYEFEGIKLLPTFHPAYLLRNPQDKKLVWQDMKKIMQFLK